MEGSGLLKGKINTTKRKIQMYNPSGEFSHTSYQLRECIGEKSVRK